MYNKSDGISKEKKISADHENFVLYGMPKEEWIQDYQENESFWWGEDWDDEDDNTGGIAPTLRPKQPKPSPNNSEAIAD